MSDKGELLEFQSFFNKHGVTFDKWKDEGHIILTVAQAHFHFDKNGNYLGAKDDEMSGWFPKEGTKR